MLRLHSAVRMASAARANFTTSTRAYVSAPGPKEVKGNSTGLDTDVDDMKSGVKEHTNKEPVDKQSDTPNIAGGEGEDAHPAKRPDPQPEPTRSTGIKGGKEEMG